MNGSGDHFQAAVHAVSGHWPPAPSFWSFSSLSNAETCPRRWMLSRADYGELWDGHGYPPRPALPALTGSVVHRCLELLLAALQARGCRSIGDPHSVEAIRELGGFSELVATVTAEQLEALQRNPRAIDSQVVLGKQLTKELPHIRERVQMAISRAQLSPGARGGDARPDAAGNSGTAEGSHGELELRADDLRLMGVADLVTVDGDGCTITDYKTGEPSEHHAEQVRLYALLWSYDRQANPGQIPAEKLVVSYATHDEVVDAPSDAELGSLADEITARIDATEKNLALRPPPANPHPETCRFCDVRHLCDDYWASVAPTLAADRIEPSGSFLDFQGEVVGQNGPRSWMLKLDGEPGWALLRTLTESPGFAIGDLVRLLAVLAGTVESDGTTQLVLTMTPFSESYVLDRA